MMGPLGIEARARAWRKRAEDLYATAAELRKEGDTREAETYELAAADFMEDAERVELGMPLRMVHP